MRSDDPGDAPAVYSGSGTTANGSSYTVNADGTVDYVPAADFTGTETFVYTVTDADGDSATATATVSIDAVPDPVDDSFVVLETRRPR